MASLKAVLEEERRGGLQEVKGGRQRVTGTRVTHLQEVPVTKLWDFIFAPREAQRRWPPAPGRP